jgi:hypothetical protein
LSHPGSAAAGLPSAATTADAQAFGQSRQNPAYFSATHPHPRLAAWQRHERDEKPIRPRPRSVKTGGAAKNQIPFSGNPAIRLVPTFVFNVLDGDDTLFAFQAGCIKVADVDVVAKPGDEVVA